MRLELKPSQNPWFVVSGPSEVQVLDVSSQKEFSERKMVGKKWIYLERNTSQTECGPSQRESLVVSKGVLVSFYGLGNQSHRLISGRIIPTILGLGYRFSGIGSPPTVWSFDSRPWNYHGTSWCVI